MTDFTYGYQNLTFREHLGKLCPKQDGLFTKDHKKHYLTITAENDNGQKATFRCFYQFNPTATQYHDGDGLRAVINDAKAGLESVGRAFNQCFGYAGKEGAKIYLACRRATRFFLSLGMTEEDIDTLRKMIDQ